jgi:hypothetical protein
VRSPASYLIPLALPICLGLAFESMTTLKAQSNPDELAAFFEGKQVIVKLDMPATQEGVDVYPEKKRMDTGKYAGRLKKYGVSLRNGDSVMVTKVKVKDKIIEFQLGGGGYGTVGDEAYVPITPKPVEKSRREKDLEGQLSAQTDPDERRDTQRRLDDLRRERERQDRRNEQQARVQNEINKQRIEQKRLQGGARFNIRFESKQGQEGFASPQSVMEVLAAWVVFPPQNFGGAQGGPTGAAPIPTGNDSPSPNGAALASGTDDPAAAVRKGMTLEEADAALGSPANRQDKEQDGMKQTSCTYQYKDKTIHADFVNGVLVKYTISSR